MSHVVAVELVDECNINEVVGISADVDAIDDQVTLSGLETILFQNGWDVAPFRQQLESGLEGVHMITVQYSSRT